LLEDFVFGAAISTRFSTELLKTFTQNLTSLRSSAMEWFQKCIAAFSTIFFGPDHEFSFPRRNFPHRIRLRASCECSSALAIIGFVAAKCPEPK
jgi:hypothetical protein